MSEMHQVASIKLKVLNYNMYQVAINEYKYLVTSIKCQVMSII